MLANKGKRQAIQARRRCLLISRILILPCALVQQQTRRWISCLKLAGAYKTDPRKALAGQGPQSHKPPSRPARRSAETIWLLDSLSAVRFAIFSKTQHLGLVRSVLMRRQIMRQSSQIQSWGCDPATDTFSGEEGAPELATRPCGWRVLTCY